MSARDDAHSAFVNAAIALAVSVSTQRRIEENPSLPASRGPLADRLRAQQFEELLTRFRAAQQRFDEEWNRTRREGHDAP